MYSYLGPVGKIQIESKLHNEENEGWSLWLGGESGSKVDIVKWQTKNVLIGLKENNSPVKYLRKCNFNSI